VYILQHPDFSHKSLEQPSLDSPPRYTGSMILFVEDAAASRYAFARLLRGEGYEVIEAGDGNEAVAFLDGFPVDLVITDMVFARSSSMLIL
jgi:PleD family two-component response regulator